MARAAEGDGFDGLSFGDTQCLNADPFVGLTVAASVTTGLKLAVGVTNPVTRHPATTACAIASVQIESGGRAVLGIGRGDSAVSKLGLRAGTVAQLEDYLVRLQGYLRGEVVDADSHPNSLQWLSSLSLPKVPVDVAATGPAVIALGARLAERVTFNVGADAVRLAGAIAHARRVREEAGLPAEGPSLGAYLGVAPHTDAEAALQLVKPVTAVYARFSSMAGHPVDDLDPEDASVIKALGEHYDTTRHGRGDAAHIAYLNDEFVDRFGVAGTPEHCVEKLSALVDLGLERLIMVGPSRDGPPEVVAESKRLLRDVVLPGLRSEVATRVPARRG